MKTWKWRKIRQPIQANRKIEIWFDKQTYKQTSQEKTIRKIDIVRQVEANYAVYEWVNKCRQQFL